MEAVRIGKFEVGLTKGLLATSIFGHDSFDIISKFDSGHYDKDSLFEIRYDMFDVIDKKDLDNLLKNLTKRDVDYIFTFRSNDHARVKELYRIAMDLDVPAVDIDYSAYSSLHPYITGTSTILSYHSYSMEPLNRILTKIRRRECDVYKVAIKYSDATEFFKDISRVIRFKSITDKPLSFIPMGSMNSFLRVISAVYVSDLNYAMDENATAEGQISVSDFKIMYEAALRMG